MSAIHVIRSGAVSHPVAPSAIEDTGLPFLSVVELLTKVLFRGGALRVSEASDRIKLGRAVLEPAIAFMRSERLCEVFARGSTDTDLAFVLTDVGRQRALEFMAKNQYAGAAPVSFDAYVDQVKRQSAQGFVVGPQDIGRAFEGIVLDPRLLDLLGTALNSGRSLFLFGPAGTGKTFIAERLVGALPGQVLIPYAIEIDGEIITVFDPVMHREAGAPKGQSSRIERSHHDPRWVLCHRPAALTGGELTLGMLDLQFDATTRIHTAPPQLKANGGMLILDDLGRQQISAQAIMNRWIVPLDRHIEYLTLHTGKRISVPFDAIVVFSSNMKPADLADDALLRRLGYKVFVGPISAVNYRRIFRQMCESAGLPQSDEAVEYLIRGHHKRTGRPLLASVPRDIVGHVVDLARYQGRAPRLTPDVVDWAWWSQYGEDHDWGDGASTTGSNPN